MTSKGIITAIDGLRLRKGPSASTTVLDLMPLHSAVEVLERRESWFRVRWHGKEGWASSRYINLVPPSPVTRPARKHWLTWVILAGVIAFILYYVVGYYFA